MTRAGTEHIARTAVLDMNTDLVSDGIRCEQQMPSARKYPWTLGLAVAFCTAAIGVGLFLNNAWRHKAGDSEPAALLEMVPSKEASLQDLLRTTITQQQQTAALSGDDIKALRRLYAARDFQPVWFSNRMFSSQGPTSTAQAAVKILNAADQQGLSPQFYDASDLAAFETKTPQARANFEMRLTAALLRYAHDMRIGRVKPEDVYNDVSFPRRAYDPVSELTAAANANTLDGYLSGLEPADPQYRQLKQALVHYRKIAEAGGWPTVPNEKAPNDKDMSAKTLMLLSERLSREGYLSPANARADDIKSALKKYQEHSGLTPDGKLGRLTLAALNVPAADRVMAITANMERRRWLPADLATTRIMVNVADATLIMLQDGVETLRSRVVVGAPATPTPMLQTNAVALTVNPVWHVPASIIKKEIMPGLKSDPSYLARKNMRMVDNRVEQDAGPGNALGTVKFEMPNAFDVYLHDTPSKAAFNGDDRAKSHGCVRVQAILPLAKLALFADPSEADQLDAWVASGETSQHKLKTPIPVFVLYWTALAEQDGQASFRPDVYGRDRALTAALSVPV